MKASIVTTSIICLLSTVLMGGGWAEDCVERKYKVQEIDSLREAVKDRYMWGTSDLSSFTGSRWGRPFYMNEMVSSVEEQVRTYMKAGITGEDIRKADKEPFQQTQVEPTKKGNE